jgi:hypothetical protein
MRRRAAIVLLLCLATLPAFGEDDYERIRDALRTQALLDFRDVQQSLGALLAAEDIESRSGIRAGLSQRLYPYSGVGEQPSRMTVSLGAQDLRLGDGLAMSLVLKWFQSGNEPDTWDPGYAWRLTDWYKPVDRKRVPAELESSTVTVGSTEVEYMLLRSASVRYDVTIAERIRLGGLWRPYGYALEYRDTADPPEDRRRDTLDLSVSRFELTLLNIDDFLPGVDTAQPVTLVNRASFAAGTHFQGTDTILRPGVFWLPAVQVSSFPAQGNVWTFSPTVSVPLYAAWLTVKPTVANVDPWFADVDAFLNAYPLISWVCVSLDDEADVAPLGEYTAALARDRRSFIRGDDGFMGSVGGGVKHTRYYPYTSGDGAVEPFTGWYVSGSLSYRAGSLVAYVDVVSSVNTGAADPLLVAEESVRPDDDLQTTGIFRLGVMFGF